MFSDFIKSMEKIIKLEQKYHNSIGLNNNIETKIQIIFRFILQMFQNAFIDHNK